MGRHSLRIVMVLGVLVTLVGGTGIFAAFTDRATTAKNAIESGPRTAAADLKIALATLVGGMPDCDPDQDGVIGTDDLTTGVLSAIEFGPGHSTGAAAVCLFNAGSADLSIVAQVIDLVDTDTLCTGDEVEAGDVTCGNGQPGELSAALFLEMDALDCSTGQVDPIVADILATFNNNPVTFDGLVLSPGATVCVQYTASFPLTTPEVTAQLAQSDLVEWRFIFDAWTL